MPIGSFGMGCGPHRISVQVLSEGNVVISDVDENMK